MYRWGMSSGGWVLLVGGGEGGGFLNRICRVRGVGNPGMCMDSEGSCWEGVCPCRPKGVGIELGRKDRGKSNELGTKEITAARDLQRSSPVTVCNCGEANIPLGVRHASE